ncbi:glycoside hydrolase family 6 protein [Curtobacterium sp. ISL-83]|uniref:glycoside hydrolase family 6 protein n=1 Tax=Curtobacterium sp. ISL-83 TaxID=2819145 RepID=UPI001BEA58DA|nr:glycoside hydrolase family 6 protein [Curtobacterium sp. ISL-83]MBT2503071.1 glycoside hydrolase family 6 protein [Curtobacterium sp. ISL-83]
MRRRRLAVLVCGAAALAVALTVSVAAAPSTAATATGPAATGAAATGPATSSPASVVRQATAATVWGKGPYRSPTSEAAKAATALTPSDPAGAAAAATIARYPVASWLGEWTQGTALTRTIDQAVAGAQQAGTTPVFVTYAIPDRDCGGYSAGGFDETSYDAWVDTIAARLSGHRAVVVVEPDALSMLGGSRCDAGLEAQRYRILHREVRALGAVGVAAYLDGGNSNWVPVAEAARRLTAAGVQDARGFFTNVANDYPTSAEVAYADQVSAATAGSHYVIDTSRNGQGWRGTWCNGPGAGLGDAPSVAPPGTALDALLWVKTPGASDGTCNGGPAAGTWWSAAARSLVANARTAGVTATGAATAAPSAAAPSTGTAAPTGHRDAVLSDGVRRVSVRGWAFDRDAPGTALQVRVSVDGTVVQTLTAADARADVDRTFGVGADHGFAGTVSAASGRRTICLVAVGIGRGGDTGLGCAALTVR